MNDKEQSPDEKKTSPIFLAATAAMVFNSMIAGAGLDDETKDAATEAAHSDLTEEVEARQSPDHMSDPVRPKGPEPQQEEDLDDEKTKRKVEEAQNAEKNYSDAFANAKVVAPPEADKDLNRKTSEANDISQNSGDEFEAYNKDSHQQTNQENNDRSVNHGQDKEQLISSDRNNERSDSSSKGDEWSNGQSNEQSKSDESHNEQSKTNGESNGRSVSNGESNGRSVSNGESNGRSVSNGESNGRSVSNGESNGRSVSNGESNGRSVSNGESNGRSVSNGESNSRSVSNGDASRSVETQTNNSKNNGNSK